MEPLETFCSWFEVWTDSILLRVGAHFLMKNSQLSPRLHPPLHAPFARCFLQVFGWFQPQVWPSITFFPLKPCLPEPLKKNLQSPLFTNFFSSVFFSCLLLFLL